MKVVLRIRRYNTKLLGIMGKGEGQGTGRAEGPGQTTERNLAIGSGVVYVVVIAFCGCGFPMLIAGIWLLVVDFSASWLFNLGLGLVIVSSLLFVGGIIFGVLICCGVCGSKSPRNNPGQRTAATFTSPAPGEVSYPMQQYSTQYTQAGHSGGQALYPTQPQPPQYYNHGGSYPS